MNIKKSMMENQRTIDRQAEQTLFTIMKHWENGT